MENIRTQFPILAKKINEQPLIYFDNAATTQKPQAVIDAVKYFYENHNANVHRGMNPLADEATKLYEAARDTVKTFINAASRQEVVFTSGATAGINLVAQAWGRQNLKKGDRVVLSIAEHHANFVPWLQLKELGVEIDVIPLQNSSTTPDPSLQRRGKLSNSFSLDLEKAEELLQQDNVKLLAITLCSNVLGGIEHEIVKRLCAVAREQGIVTLVDAAQAIAHIPVDVQGLGCDFLVFSGHKLFGPTGIGIVYGRKGLLETIPAWQGGGDMIREVFTDRFTPNDLPYKFEAGTPNIAGAIGLDAAIGFINTIGWSEIEKREQELAAYFSEKVTASPFITLQGADSAENRAPVFSLVIEGVHAHDAADLLGQEGIIVRAGHHCAQPLHDYLGITATLRASLAFYNTEAEIDRFFEVLEKIYLKFK